MLAMSSRSFQSNGRTPFAQAYVPLSPIDQIFAHGFALGVEFHWIGRKIGNVHYVPKCMETVRFDNVSWPQPI